MRWTPQRKLEVVQEYHSNIPDDYETYTKSVFALASKHMVSVPEIIWWAQAYRKHGLDGLCVTKRTR